MGQFVNCVIPGIYVTSRVKFGIENTTRRRVFSLNLDYACDVILMVSKWYSPDCFIEDAFYNILQDSSKNDVICRNIAQAAKIKMCVLQHLHVQWSWHNFIPMGGGGVLGKGTESPENILRWNTNTNPVKNLTYDTNQL